MALPRPAGAMRGCGWCALSITILSGTRKVAVRESCHHGMQIEGPFERSSTMIAFIIGAAILGLIGIAMTACVAATLV